MQSDAYGYLVGSGWIGYSNGRQILYDTEEEYYSIQREEEVTICTESCMTKTKTSESM
ncbi:MAG: hypothetical protein J6U54_01725 [Clostridiales bacterium]|nr:hypothetical protein [Clostridiales bacterium]